MWSEGFTSVLVQEDGSAVLAMATYIDLNPVHGLSLALELAGCGQPSWALTQAGYRKRLFDAGAEGRVKGGREADCIDPAAVQEVLARGGELTLTELLHCRVRYFSHGAILGTAEYIENFFQRHRHWFSPRRKDGPRTMVGGSAWGPLRVLRKLRLRPIG